MIILLTIIGTTVISALVCIVKKCHKKEEDTSSVPSLISLDELMRREALLNPEEENLI